MTPFPVTSKDIPGADEIRPGDVRLVAGVAGLVIKDWLGDGQTFVVCPVKPLDENDEETTGKVVFVEMSRREMGFDLLDGILADPDPEDPTALHGAALPDLGCTVEARFIGKLLYRVFPVQLHRCQVVFGNWITDIREKDDLDIDRPHSADDIRLSRLIQRDSMGAYLDSGPAWVFEPDGNIRPETEEEWQRRLRKRRKAEERAARKAEKAKRAALKKA